MQIHKQVETKKQLQDFTESITDMREDYHEASSQVEAVVTGEILDNEGFDNEIMIRLIDKKKGGYMEIKLATLLGIAAQD